MIIPELKDLEPACRRAKINVKKEIDARSVHLFYGCANAGFLVGAVGLGGSGGLSAAMAL